MSKRGDSNQNKGKEVSLEPTISEMSEEGKNGKADFRGRGGFGGRGRGRPPSGEWKPLKCFICDEAHKAIDCSQNPKRVMVAQEQEKFWSEAKAESGENLMLKRTLISKNKEIPKVDWKRKSVFWTKCKCKNRVCKVIIDGGSTNNLVNTKMVHNLQFACILKANPYKIFWLKKSHSVLVDKSCLIAFKIGPYVVKSQWMHAICCWVGLGNMTGM